MKFVLQHTATGAIMAESEDNELLEQLLTKINEIAKITQNRDNVFEIVSYINTKDEIKNFINDVENELGDLRPQKEEYLKKHFEKYKINANQMCCYKPHGKIYDNFEEWKAAGCPNEIEWVKLEGTPV